MVRSTNTKILLRTALSMASRYQAVKQGGPFELVRVPKADPAEGEIQIRMKAVALNPLDWKQLYVKNDEYSLRQG